MIPVKLRGFTLIEVLVASALLFLCISIALISLSAGSQSFNRGNETVKAYQDSRKILEIITTELREADPATLSGGGSSVSFMKYHNPASKNQTVTWSLDSNGHRVRRDYVSGGASGPSSEFGENIMDLSFNISQKGTPPEVLKIVTISMNVQSGVVAAGGVRRDIIRLDTKVYLRERQKTNVTVRFTNPTTRPSPTISVIPGPPTPAPGP